MRTGLLQGGDDIRYYVIQRYKATSQVILLLTPLKRITVELDVRDWGVEGSQRKRRVFLVNVGKHGPPRLEGLSMIEGRESSVMGAELTRNDASGRDDIFHRTLGVAEPRLG